MSFYEENEALIGEATKKAIIVVKEYIKNYGEDKAIKEIHRVIDKTQKKIEIDKKTSCHLGCSLCCHDEITLSKTEANYLKPLLKKTKRNKKILNRQNSRGFKNLTWAEKQCSLLKNGRCSIYNNRPIVCRLHNSSDEPQECEINMGKGHQQVYVLELVALEMALYFLDREKYQLHKILKE